MVIQSSREQTSTARVTRSSRANAARGRAPHLPLGSWLLGGGLLGGGLLGGGLLGGGLLGGGFRGGGFLRGRFLRRLSWFCGSGSGSGTSGTDPAAAAIRAF